MASLPDLGARINLGGAQVLCPTNEFRGATYYLLPNGLTLADNADGAPDFLLESVRGSSRIYGSLRFGVKPQYPADALSALQPLRPGAVLEPAPLVRGFVRLAPVAPLTGLPPESVRALILPVPLTHLGAGISDFQLTLPDTATDFLRDMLTGGALLIVAHAEIEIAGLAPLVKGRARVNPRLFTGALQKLAIDGNIPWSALLQVFRRSIQNKANGLPIEFLDAIPQLDANDTWATALAGWTRIRYLEFVPASDLTIMPGETYVRLRNDAPVSEGSDTWDLVQTLVATLPMALPLNPIETVRQSLRTRGITYFCPEISVPPLHLGPVAVVVQCNFRLPSDVDGLDVIFYLDPNPTRKSRLLKTLPLAAPGTAREQEQQRRGENSIELPFRMTEKKCFRYRCRILRGGVPLTGDPGTERISEAIEIDKGLNLMHLDISADDLPVKLMSISASRQLLSEADISGRCEWSLGTTRDSMPFHIPRDTRSQVLMLPRESTNAVWSVLATQRGGDRTVALLPLAQEDLTQEDLPLTLFSFPESLRHRIDVRCIWSERAVAATIAFSPEGEKGPCVTGESDGEELKFAAEEPNGVYSWTPRSMFHSGYCYKVKWIVVREMTREKVKRIDSSWSAARSFRENLTLDFAVDFPMS